ncbi:hypothetical protein [Shouchella patagoniensis]|uniref:hypothetical protein n=1 Tax=Shouchella patagoniensis TaxID=228576 RepID=UPI000995C7D3|nr:hypothetical protein [Shouchella patagoniensis]
MNNVTLLSGHIDQYKNLSNFTTLKDFNSAVEMFLAEHKKRFSKGEYIAFMRLTKYMCKFRGVANAKAGTLLKVINEKQNGYGVSRSTFFRMLQKAKQFGAIQVQNTQRKRGGQGHNVYVFQPIDTPHSRKLTHRENERSSTYVSDPTVKSGSETGYFKTNKTKSYIRKRGQALDATFARQSVPVSFIQIMKNTFKEQATAQLVEEYWRMVEIQTTDVPKPLVKEMNMEMIAVQALQITRRKIERARTRNPIAYFTGVLKKKLDQDYENLTKILYQDIS